MRRIRLVSRMPERAATIAPDVKLTFIVEVLTAAVPMFTNKDPQNSARKSTTSTATR